MTDGQFDGVFMQVVQANKGIDGFFDEVFGFFRRKTDFFTNPKQGEETIRKTFGNALIKYGEQKKTEEQEQKEKQRREEERKKKQQQESEQKKQVHIEKPKLDIQKPVEIPAPSTENSDEKKEDEGPAPLGNGGSTDKYTWTQTLVEMNMYIPVDSQITGKTVKVAIGINHLTVHLNGEKFIDSDFPERINVDDSLWTLETEGKEKFIHITIQKFSNQMHWWDCALQGDAKIDTKKINPENSKLGDLDGETRTTVEKMMFDMRQKQMGLPSSDDLQKQEMMKKFMNQHPEMDFSKCKFS